jgi:hypothetical protein
MMGRLADQLRREQEQDARRANRAAVNELRANPEDGSFSKHLDKVRADQSRERIQKGRDFLSRNLRILDSGGPVGLLQESLPGLTLEEARYLVEEARPTPEPEPMELGYTGEIYHSRGSRF